MHEQSTTTTCLRRTSIVSTTLRHRYCSVDVRHHRACPESGLLIRPQPAAQQRITTLAEWHGAYPELRAAVAECAADHAGDAGRQPHVFRLGRVRDQVPRWQGDASAATSPSCRTTICKLSAARVIFTSILTAVRPKPSSRLPKCPRPLPPLIFGGKRRIFAAFDEAIC